MREFSAESKGWLASYFGSIDATALLIAFDAGRASAPDPSADSQLLSFVRGAAVDYANGRPVQECFDEILTALLVDSPA